MAVVRPTRRFPALLFILAAVFVITALTGCDVLDRLGDDKGEINSVAVTSVNHGLCSPIYGSRVDAAAISGDGSRVMYVTRRQPANWPDDRGWRSTDRALMVRDIPAVGDATVRYIAVTWPGEDIGAYATAEPDGGQVKPRSMPETMVDLRLAKDGERFVVGVVREGVVGQYAKLYSGTVPATGSAELEPENGLSLIPINDYKGTEGINYFVMSDDGSKLAAAVGDLGEVRIYDLDSQELTVYTRGEEGETIVEHTLPRAPTNLTDTRVPAVASKGTIHLALSPSGDRLTIAHDEDVPGQTALTQLDIASGELVLVRRFVNSTVPHVVWASDGQSLFVLNTPLVPGTIFGDTEIRRLAAAKDGREVSPGGKLPRSLGYRTEPAFLTGFGDDEHFIFVWEQSLWRLTAPGGNPAKASYIQLTRPTMEVRYLPPSVSVSSERAVFVVEDLTGTHVGERTDIFDDACPRLATPTPESAEDGTGSGDEGAGASGGEEGAAGGDGS